MSHLALWNQAPVSPPTESDKQQELLLGKDIFFDGDYSITSAGDFAFLSGIEALRAAIYRRLITRPGEYKIRPEYGVGIQDFLKRRRLPSTLDELRQRVVDQLSLEARIEEVVDVVVESITDGIRVGVVIRASGDALKFEPFDFVERQTVQIGGTATVGLRIG